MTLTTKDLELIKKCAIATFVFWTGALMYNILMIVFVIFICGF
jgi:hypothetical protein